MAETKNTAPMKLKVLIVIVHDDKADFYSSVIQSHQVNIQLRMPAQGTTHLILNYLGLVERPKTIFFCPVREDEAKTLINLLGELFQKGKDYKGVAFTVPMSSIIGTLSYGFLGNDHRTVKEEA